MLLSYRTDCYSLELCVMETRARIDPQPHVNCTPERCQPCLLFRYVCACVCVCPVNLISANREKWINNGKANTVADRREKGGTARDGWRGGRDNEVTGVTRGMESERERNEQRERRTEKTGQPRSYEPTKLIANKKRGRKQQRRVIKRGGGNKRGLSSERWRTGKKRNEEVKRDYGRKKSH